MEVVVEEAGAAVAVEVAATKSMGRRGCIVFVTIHHRHDLDMTF